MANEHLALIQRLADAARDSHLMFQAEYDGNIRLAKELWEPFMADVHEFSTLTKTGALSEDEIRAGLGSAKVLQAKLDEHKVNVNLRVAELQYLLRARGPIQLEAIEQQYLAIRVCSTLKDDWVVHHVARELKRATAYCWTTESVEAVADAAHTLPGTAKPTVSGMGEMFGTGSAGWWWFEQPLPIPGSKKPIIALLWLRMLGSDGSLGTQFFAFVEHPAMLGGRLVVCPASDHMFEWPDHRPISELIDMWDTSTNNNMPESAAKGGYSVAKWFCRFWLAAGTWLQQRVLVRHRTALPRQPGRAIARSQKLEAPPTVEIIHLRRNEKSTTTESVGEGGTRNWTCRWVVHGFWRNQFYPSRGEHAQKWIDDFVKGPSDKPLKTATRVYAVDR